MCEVTLLRLQGLHRSLTWFLLSQGNGPHMTVTNNQMHWLSSVGKSPAKQRKKECVMRIRLILLIPREMSIHVTCCTLSIGFTNNKWLEGGMASDFTLVLQSDGWSGRYPLFILLI